MNRSCLVMGIALSSASGACSAQVDSSPPRSPVTSEIGSDRAAELCAGLPQPEMERPYFLRQGGIEEVRPFRGGHSTLKPANDDLRGADIFVRPSPELTRTTLARMLRCHLADPVSLAFRESFEDPLLVGTPRVSLEQSPEGFVIRIAGHDGAEGQEILRRAERLRQPREGSTRD